MFNSVDRDLYAKDMTDKNGLNIPDFSYKFGQ